MLIREAYQGDRDQIAKVYRAVAGKVHGIARRSHEITDTYIFSLLNKDPKNIAFLVAVDEKSDKIIGFVYAVKSGLLVHHHILTDYTIVVSPDHQSQGLGRDLFISFLHHLEKKRPDVLRLEMEVFVDPIHIKTYEKLGFVKEGVIEKRHYDVNGNYSDSVLMVWFNPNFIPRTEN